MKQLLQTLDELKMYSGCDSVGVLVVDEVATFMFVFTELGVVSKISLPVIEISSSVLADSTLETALLERLHGEIGAFKKSKGTLG